MERGIEVVRRWAEEAVRPVELLACTPERGKSTLEALNVTERSPLGGIAGRTGGILVDSGWLRILGAGSERLARGLAEWNGLGGRLRLGGALLVGDDAVGGFFALNGGALPGGVGNIFYLAPDTLEWEDLEVRYSGWVKWAFTGALDGFYEDARWPSWKEDVEALDSTHAFSVFPWLFTEGPPISQRVRKPVPVEELWGLHAVELPKQLGLR